jgi:hypothetical protein
MATEKPGKAVSRGDHTTANPLDNFSKPFIISMKDGEEDEYAPPGRYREREEMRARPYSSAEWTSELQGKRLARM